MKKNSGYFGISKALLNENFKLHWYLPVIIFSFYFLSGILPIIISDNNGSIASYTIGNYNPGFIAIMMFAPIIVSCVMMGFYHRPAASFALHSQPYSKSKLFNTQIITGWLMLIVPIIIMGALFFLIMGSVDMIEVNTFDYGIQQPVKMVEAYGAIDVVIWVLVSISEMSFFYFLYTLAGALVGSTVMQILCSLVLVNLIPSVVGLGNLYSDRFILGYYGTPDWVNLLIENSNPLLKMLYYGMFGLREQSDKLPYLWYFAAGIVFLILAKTAYSKGKLERVGDSMIFDLFESTITVAVATIGGALSALIFSTFIDGKFIIASGAALGLLLTFFVTRIVIERSIKIFSARNLRILISSILVMTAFILIFAYDIAGYSKRAVNIDKVESLNVEDLISADGTSELSAYNLDLSEFGISSEISDRTTIEKVYELNRYILENDLCSLEKDWERDRTIIFNYKLKSGGQWMRRYHVRFDKQAEEMFRNIMSSNPVVSARSVADGLKGKVNHIMVMIDAEIAGSSKGNFRHSEFLVTDKEDIAAILEARDRDMRDVDYTKSDDDTAFTYSLYVDVNTASRKHSNYENEVHFYFSEKAESLNALIEEFEKKYNVSSEYSY